MLFRLLYSSIHVWQSSASERARVASAREHAHFARQARPVASESESQAGWSGRCRLTSAAGRHDDGMDDGATYTRADGVTQAGVAASSAAAASKPTRSGATTGDILALSRPERPTLMLGLLLRAGAEATGLVTPLLLAAAYEAVAKEYGEDGVYTEETRDTVARTFVLVLAVHVAGNALGFVAGVLIGVASERVVARARDPSSLARGALPDMNTRVQ